VLDERLAVSVGVAVRVELADRRNVVSRAEHHANAVVAERIQVPERLLDRVRIVDGN
jgi:hypothetical protein